MTQQITELQALDIDAHLTSEGPAILSLITTRDRFQST